MRMFGVQTNEETKGYINLDNLVAIAPSKEKPEEDTMIHMMGCDTPFRANEPCEEMATRLYKLEQLDREGVR